MQSWARKSWREQSFVLMIYLLVEFHLLICSSAQCLSMRKLPTCFVLQVPHFPSGFADSMQSCAPAKVVKLKAIVNTSLFILSGFSSNVIFQAAIEVVRDISV